MTNVNAGVPTDPATTETTTITELTTSTPDEQPPSPRAPTSPHLAKRHSMATKRVAPEMEGSEIEKLWVTALSESQTWFLIDTKWWKSWCSFTGFNPDTGLCEAFGDDKNPTARPGQIDNTPLQSTESNFAIKQQIAENIDYNIVIQPVWNKLLAWYSGGPDFPRQVHLVGINNKARLDMYPVFLTFYDMNVTTKDALDSEGKFLSFNRRKKVQELIQQLQEDGNPKEKEEIVQEGKEKQDEKEEMEEKTKKKKRTRR